AILFQSNVCRECLTILWSTSTNSDIIKPITLINFITILLSIGQGFTNCACEGIMKNLIYALRCFIQISMNLIYPLCYIHLIIFLLQISYKNSLALHLFLCLPLKDNVVLFFLYLFF